jgi:hypothetical protein
MQHIGHSHEPGVHPSILNGAARRDKVVLCCAVLCCVTSPTHQSHVLQTPKLRPPRGTQDAVKFPFAKLIHHSGSAACERVCGSSADRPTTPNRHLPPEVLTPWIDIDPHLEWSIGRR